MTAADSLELLRLLRGRLPSADEIETIRLRRLRALVRFAHARVPYYRRLLDGAGIGPDDLRRVEDLRHVPVSTCDDLRAAGEEIYARGIDRGAGIEARTSGSTGRPWTIFRTPAENRLRRALDLRSLRHAGVRPGDRIAVLGPAVPAAPGPPGRVGLYRTEQVSPLLPLDEQITRLRALAPTVLWIYPAMLRSLLERAGSLSAVARPRLMVTSAEPLDEPVRRRVLADLPLEIRDFYGAVESGRIAWECAAGEGLHLNTDCLIVDFLDEESVPGGGSPLVVTNLLARSMPVLRYRIGDRGELAGRPCSCGRPLPLMRPPFGRDWDLVALPSGRLVPPFAVAAHLNGFPGLRQYRVHQESRDRLRIEIRCERPPEPATVDAARSGLLAHFGEPITIDFEPVERIPEIAGKSRTFVSRLTRLRPGAPDGP